jgi:hypothetical protein
VPIQRCTADVVPEESARLALGVRREAIVDQRRCGQIERIFERIYHVDPGRSRGEGGGGLGLTIVRSMLTHAMDMSRCKVHPAEERSR